MSDESGVAIPQSHREWIESKLSALDMVQWDRYAAGDWYGEQPHFTVYGWIDRQDEYKDFVVVIFWPENENFYFTTSSEEYTQEIYRRLVGEEPEKHNDCQRVEHTFDVENAIELDHNSSLEEFA